MPRSTLASKRIEIVGAPALAPARRRRGLGLGRALGGAAEAGDLAEHAVERHRRRSRARASPARPRSAIRPTRRLLLLEREAGHHWLSPSSTMEIAKNSTTKATSTSASTMLRAAAGALELGLPRRASCEASLPEHQAVRNQRGEQREQVEHRDSRTAASRASSCRPRSRSAQADAAARAARNTRRQHQRGDAVDRAGRRRSTTAPALSGSSSTA